jgi:hypothetical protein
MKEIIIGIIQSIERKKKDEKRHPYYPTEKELRIEISNLVTKELNTLIEEGIIIVAGTTINKDKLLTIKNEENENITN